MKCIHQNVLFASISLFVALGVSKIVVAQTSLPQPQLDPTAEGILRNAGLGHLSNSDKAKVIDLLLLVRNSNSGAGCPTSSHNAIESEIEGSFEGWDGDTIFKLTNGQIWQQDEYDYEYGYEYNPDVLIFKDGSNWKIKVEGMDDTISVKCIS